MNQTTNTSHIFPLTSLISDIFLANIFPQFPAIFPKLVDERRLDGPEGSSPLGKHEQVSYSRTRSRASSRLRRDYVDHRWHRSLGVSVFLRRKKRRSQWLQVIFSACRNIPTASLRLVTPSPPPLSRAVNSVLFVDDSLPPSPLPPPPPLSFTLWSISERKVLYSTVAPLPRIDAAA